MAIKFLNNIDLENNQLKDFKVDNVTADPTGLAGEGQLIYRTDTDELKYHSGSNTWVTLGDAAAAGTVTSITPAADTGTGTAITGIGILTLSSGSALITTSVTGTTWTINTTATNNVGTVTSVSVVPGGLVLTGSASSTPTLAMDYLGATGVNNFIMEAATATPAANGSDYLLFNDVSAGGFAGNVSKALVSAFPGFGANGTVTEISGSGGTTGLTLTPTSSAPITGVGTLTLGGTLIAANGGTGQSTYTVGDILYASGTGTLSKLGIGSTGQVLKVAGGIPSWAADTNTGLTSVGITESGNALQITNSPLTANGTINIAGAGTSSQIILGDLTLATLPVDGVTSIGITGGTGLDVTGTPVTGSGTIGIALDLNGLGTVTSIDPATDFIVGASPTANNEKILYSNVHLNQWGDAEADVDFGGNKLLDVGTGTLGTDGVNLAQVQAIAAGVGVFQGGYNATTNSPALSGASNVALVQGDFYVVTVGGTFFTEAVEVGDLIFANGTIPASSSPAVTAYTIVQADANIAGSGATDGATEKGVAGFDSANFSVSANGWVQITDVTLGTETSGNYTQSVAASTSNALLGVDVSGATGEGQSAVVGIDITGQTALTTVADADELLIYDADGIQNKKVTVSNLSDGILGASTFSATVTSASSSVAHNLGTRDVIVQLYDTVTYDTVYADIERVTTNGVTILFSAAPTNGIRVLVSKVG